MHNVWATKNTLACWELRLIRPYGRCKHMYKTSAGIHINEHKRSRMRTQVCWDLACWTQSPKEQFVWDSLGNPFDVSMLNSLEYVYIELHAWTCVHSAACVMLEIAFSQLHSSTCIRSLAFVKLHSFHCNLELALLPLQSWNVFSNIHSFNCTLQLRICRLSSGSCIQQCLRNWFQDCIQIAFIPAFKLHSRFRSELHSILHSTCIHNRIRNCFQNCIQHTHVLDLCCIQVAFQLRLHSTLHSNCNQVAFKWHSHCIQFAFEIAFRSIQS
jgi:hypothetical protein